jgi:hypothetical protein
VSSAPQRGSTNGKLPPTPAITISLEAPRPLLDEGEYSATCTDATVAWSRRWKKWIARLVMEPSNYTGRPYSGSLCKFFQLGSNPKRPHAGQQSEFRKLLVRLNGAQPVNGEASLALFVGVTFQIKVCTVKERNGEHFDPQDWYSKVGEISPALTTHEHTNTRTQQHTNTATHQPINTLTTKNTATPLTQQHTRPEREPEVCMEEDLTSGNEQHTHNVHPDHGVGPDSAPCAQPPHCYVHGAKTTWWKRGEDHVCEQCHPNPSNSFGVN